MAIPPQLLIAAAQQAQRGSAAVKGDLAVIRLHKPPKKVGKGKKAVMVPGREVEIHVSPAAVGLGIFTVGAGLTVGWIWWNGVKIPTLLGSIEVIPGAKDGVKAVYRDNKKKLQDWIEKKKEPKAEQKAVVSPGVSGQNPYPEGSWAWILWNSTH